MTTSPGEHTAPEHGTGTVPAEVASTMAGIRSACVEADGQDPIDEAATLAIKYGADDLEWWSTGDAFALRRGSELDVAVQPTARGAGRGEALVRHALADGHVTGAWSHGDHPAAVRLADRFGFAATRSLWVMRRPMPAAGGPAIPEAALRDGVRIVGFEHDRDLAAVLEINAAAFASHPEQGAMDEADFFRRSSEDWFDPAGLLIALDEKDRHLGFHWTKRHDEHLGEVYVVAVSPQAQGMGLGKALTIAGLSHLDNVDEVLLYVESDNSPAIATYAGVDFGHADSDTHVHYQLVG